MDHSEVWGNFQHYQPHCRLPRLENCNFKSLEDHTHWYILAIFDLLLESIEAFVCQLCLL